MTGAPLWVGGGPTLLAAVRSRRARRRNAPVFDFLLARLGGEMRKGALFARHGEIDLRLRLVPSTEPLLIVSVVCRPAGRFRITASTRLQRALAPFVPALPFATHDRAFDGAHTVQTRDVHLTGDVLGHGPVREAVTGLLAGAAREVRLDGDRVKAVLVERRLPDDGPDQRGQLLLSVAEELSLVARSVDAFAGIRSVSYAPRRDKALVAGWCVTALIGLGSVGLFLWGLHQARPVDPRPVHLVPLALGLGLGCLTTLAMAQLLRGRTSPQCLVMTHALIHLAALPLAALGLALLFLWT